MQTIPLAAVPNQQVTVNVGGNRWTLKIKVGNKSLVADVTFNDTPILLGQRLAVGTPLIPYRYMQSNGNFLLIVDGDELPDWQQLGLTQQLLYVTADELAANPDLDWSFSELPTPVVVGTLLFDGTAMYDGEYYYDGQGPAV